ncbi:esterase [Dickeya fangzhongdai]|uniref:esterase n=1 Tax=Dickeya fangzhongdai TaxID=1778540 RepID=UPI0004F8251D|nr:esterase [Dickeya fangzhongdai]AIR70799.1 esterase [Dickeya fangzhongdai]KGT99078.1 esterase [Dickeya fangzhongdai]
MVEMGSENVSGIEVLHAFPSGARTRPLPTIFFFHGYTSSKEVYSYFAYALAKAGFRVIAPDALMHGARFDGDEARRWRCFWDIFLNNVRELPVHLDWCREQGLIDGDRIGICGASMGGMTALAAMTQYPWLRAVACFMGSGYFSSLSQTLFPPVAPEEPGAQTQLQALADRVAPFDVRHQLDRVSDRPLLLWHGLADELVPAQESARLHRELTARHSHQRLTYLTEAGIGHKITPTALQVGADFFSRSL